jgi:uncharacterized membrane protein HdeD (DUF308 family)
MTTNFSAALRTLYFIRFGFALAWAALVFVTGGVASPVLTVLVLVYPLADAVAVFWQLRAEGPGQASRLPEWINVVLSGIAAIALGIVSTISVPAVLTVWGIWAIASGIVQLATAVLRRRLGGQVPLILSGALSVLAGFGFASGAVPTATGIGGYAIVGGIFFLIAAIRLTVLLRKSA